MRGVDQTPAAVDAGIGKQAIRSAARRSRQRSPRLLSPVGDMYVDRPVDQRRHLGQFLRRRGAQAVRRDADDRTVQVAACVAACRSGGALRVVDEAPLPRIGRGAAEGRVRVKDRQQRQREMPVALAAAAIRSAISARLA